MSCRPNSSGTSGPALDDVLHDPAVKACVLCSAKKDFIAGADLKRVYAMKDPSEGSLFSSKATPCWTSGRQSQALRRGHSGPGGGRPRGGSCVPLSPRSRLPETVLALPEVTLASSRRRRNPAVAPAGWTHRGP